MSACPGCVFDDRDHTCGYVEPLRPKTHAEKIALLASVGRDVGTMLYRTEDADGKFIGYLTREEREGLDVKPVGHVSFSHDDTQRD
jgi:hypothetical protein